MAMDWENYGRDRRNNVRRQSVNYHESFEGNAVRKTSQTVPNRREREYVRPQRQVRHTPHRKPVRMPGISFVGFAFSMLLLTAVISVSFMYISTKNNVHGMKNKLVSLQMEVSSERELYDEEYSEIETSVDLSKIYEKATKKLKMVHASNNQIYKYKCKKSDLVKQYADIPGAE